VIVPKLRIIAGPNGSGKSTLIEYLRENFALSFGFYLNADEVEKTLSKVGGINLSDWNLSVKEEFLLGFLAGHPLAPRLSISGVRVLNNALIVPSEAAGGYFAACLSDFIRKEWVKSGQSFTFETVMSGADKLDLLQTARGAGFRVYLYFVCTDDLEINRRRVAFRVAEGGHDVPSDKISSRYHASLANLRSAIWLSNRAYLFDNSGTSLRFFAEFEEQKLVQVSEHPPNWFITSGLVDSDEDPN
jgi:predicted ABC-type ATPase